MTTEEFRTVLHQSPFVPFIIHMVDGRTFEVTHRDFVALSQTGRTAIVFQREGGFSLLDMRLMSELQVSNGHSESL